MHPNSMTKHPKSRETPPPLVRPPPRWINHSPDACWRRELRVEGDGGTGLAQRHAHRVHARVVTHRALNVAHARLAGHS